MMEEKLSKTLSSEKTKNQELTAEKFLFSCLKKYTHFFRFADDHLNKLFKSMKRESRVLDSVYQALIPDMVDAKGF